MPDRDRIHEVMVVPILAPIMIPTACESCMIPELTNPTTITVVADDDWMTAVTATPSSTAIIRFDVSFSNICSSLPPDSFARPSPIASIPYRNMAKPPIIVRTLNMFILSLLYTLCRPLVHSEYFIISSNVFTIFHLLVIWESRSFRIKPFPFSMISFRQSLDNSVSVVRRDTECVRWISCLPYAEY